VVITGARVVAGGARVPLVVADVLLDVGAGVMTDA